jgi:hypothetical protein
MKLLGALILAGILASFYGVEQGPDECLQELRTGTFYYYNGSDIVEVKRTKTHQYEKYKGGKTENKLTWVSENAYELRFVAKNSTPGCLEDGEKMLITMSNCTPDFYTAIITSDKCGSGEAMIYRDKKKLQKALKNYTE